MAVPEKIANRTERIVAALREARHLSLGDRDSFVEIMKRSCIATNGMSAEEKLQACSENIADLCYLIIKDKLEGPATVGFWPSLFRLIDRHPVAFVVLVLGAYVLAGYRPEIVENLKAFRALLTP